MIALRTKVASINVSPLMTVEVAEYPERKKRSLVMRMVQLRMGNRTVWTWADITPDQARKIGEALIEAASREDGKP